MTARPHNSTLLHPSASLNVLGDSLLDQLPLFHRLLQFYKHIRSSTITIYEILVGTLRWHFLGSYVIDPPASQKYLSPKWQVTRRLPLRFSTGCRLCINFSWSLVEGHTIIREAWTSSSSVSMGWRQQLDSIPSFHRVLFIYRETVKHCLEPHASQELMNLSLSLTPQGY